VLRRYGQSETVCVSLKLLRLHSAIERGLGKFLCLLGAPTTHARHDESEGFMIASAREERTVALR